MTLGLPRVCRGVALLQKGCRLSVLDLPAVRYSTLNRQTGSPAAVAESFRTAGLSPFRPPVLTVFGRNQSDVRDSLVTPVFLQAEKYGDKLALVDEFGNHSYQDLLLYSSDLAQQIKGREGNRIAVLCDNDVSSVVSLFAVWMCGGVAVPLCKTHPASQWQYFLENSQASVLIAGEKYSSSVAQIEGIDNVETKFISPESLVKSDGRQQKQSEATTKSDTSTSSSEPNMSFHDLYALRPSFDSVLKADGFRSKPALIIYTSGSTGRPKGVVHTYGNLHAQMSAMVEAWAWSSQDVLLHVLPLHHVHGLVNALMTPLHMGSTCVMMTQFDAAEVWLKLLQPVDKETGLRVNLFMAVPTIYAKLVQYYKDERKNNPDLFSALNSLPSHVRLMVSGSAALPQPLLQQWRKITGLTLLERYGMTEIGMGLTNPLHGTRIPGAVGNPFPGVEVCIAKPNEDSPTGYDIVAQGNSRETTITPGEENEQGELMVRGPSVFKEYYGKPEATKEAFTEDGWFKTGDTALFNEGVYRIVGRTSVDIIKSGAFKISALDIERHLLSHRDIRECAVVGLPDPVWGQKVAVVLVSSPGVTITREELKEWCSHRMPSYHIPRVLKCMEELPRNTMGKVNKKELVKDIFPEYLNNDAGSTTS